MDPETQGEKMEDVSAPSERGFIDDSQTDQEALEQIEKPEESQSSEEDCD